MIVRDMIRCKTCDHVSTVRISVGHDNYQRHDFACVSCEEPIGLGMYVDFKKVSTKLDFCENCEQADEEGTIVNLNPHFLMSETDQGQDQNFSWMSQSHYIMGNSSIPPILVPRPHLKGIKFRDTYEELGGIYCTSELWSTIKKGWSLTNNHKQALAQKVLKKYKPSHFKGPFTLHAVLNDFLYCQTLPRAYVYFDRAKECLEVANFEYSEELKRFAKYYRDNLRTTHQERYFDIFSSFFENFSEFDQAILYVKNCVPVIEGYIASSHGFNKTKMFYGNAFEAFTSNIVVLACLNNILEGRKFDEFLSMDLAKYQTINKANRGNPFSENGQLNPFLDCIESPLRNASHHGSIKLINKGKEIQYQSGGTGAIHVMTYSKYLEKCNMISLRLASLYLFETALLEYA